MENKKRRFRVAGEIEANGKRFKEYTYASNESHAIKLTSIRLEERYPNMKIYLINVEARDITYLNKEHLKMYEKVLTIKTK